MVPTNCFACGKAFDAAAQGSDQPSRGTVFHSDGNYGSTVFDPMRGGVTLTLNICDDCLVSNKLHVQYVQTTTKIEREVRPWNPGEDN